MEIKFGKELNLIILITISWIFIVALYMWNISSLMILFLDKISYFKF